MNKLKMRFPGFLKKALTLSYDDGVESDINLIKLLNKYNMKATFNLNSGLFNTTNKYDRRLNEKEILSLYNKYGMEVASHTLTHPHLENLSHSEALNEIRADKANLERLLGHEILGFAYPFGTYNEMTIDILKSCGIKYARGVESSFSFDIPEDHLKISPTCRHKDKNLMELLDSFLSLNRDECALFYLWGHSYEFKLNNNWYLIEEFLKKASNKKDIYYATNIEIFSYIEAFNLLLKESTEEKIINNSDNKIYLSYDNKNYIIEPHSELRVKN